MSNDELKPDEPFILAIETATRAGGVAVAQGQNVLASMAGDASISHSTNLIEMIQDALRKAEVMLNDVAVFAVAVGPGSFTGLRIGLATVKAFAVHLDRKVVGIPTLAAVAHASRASGEIVSLLPAGRGEVFAQRFSVDADEVRAIDEAQHLNPAAVIEKYRGVGILTFAGEGVGQLEKFGVPPSGGTDKNTKIPPEGGTPNWRLLPDASPLAPSIAVLGYRAYQEGKAVGPESLHAVYVRASDAEINERWLQQKLQQQAHS